VVVALALTACGGGTSSPAKPPAATASDQDWCKDYVKKNVNYQGTGFDTAVDGCLSLLRDGILKR